MTAADQFHHTLATACRGSLVKFCWEFWGEIPGAGRMVPSWHILLFCEELERLARRVHAGLPREYDLVVNVPPGTSKSSIFSILFPCWLWTFFPEARVLTGSHADSLVLDLSNKARHVVKSEKYRALFPGVQLRSDQDTKGYYANTAGGERMTCTVGGKSPIGRHAHVLIVDDPIDPGEVLSEVGLETAKAFITNYIANRKVDKEVTPTVLVMQRLGVGDPTEVMLEAGRAEGAFPVRHVCLPSEATEDVSPPGARSGYRSGLLDPVRLGPRVIAENRARGALFYSTQFLQKPYSAEGGLFRAPYFNRRVQASPHDARRVLYVDRAATASTAARAAAACYTAMVLMSRDSRGSFFVEHVTHGQWEPNERNDRILAEALRCRSRYGPTHEPAVYIEAERGSTGVESFQNIARLLAGFNVREDMPTGSKEVRAEPWSAQLAAGTVSLVEDGTWDVAGYVQEHLAFPLGRYKDQVDASSGACNLLLKGQARPAPLRTYALGTQSKNQLKIVVGSRDDFRTAIIEVEARVLVIDVVDPAVPAVGTEGVERADNLERTEGGERVVRVKRTVGFERADRDDGNGMSERGQGGEIVREERTVKTDPLPCPLHLKGTGRLLDSLTLTFVDLEPAALQDRWNEVLEPWNLPPAELVMDRDHGRALWRFLTKKRPEDPQVLVVRDDRDGRRALSLACAIADVLRLPRGVVFRPANPEAKSDGPAPNKHVYDAARAARALVV